MRLLRLLLSVVVRLFETNETLTHQRGLDQEFLVPLQVSLSLTSLKFTLSVSLMGGPFSLVLLM